mgnify:CR=1 FL=1
MGYELKAHSSLLLRTQYAMGSKDLIILSLVTMFATVAKAISLKHFRIFFGIFLTFCQFRLSYPIKHRLLFLEITNLIMMLRSANIMELILKIMALNHCNLIMAESSKTE